MDGSTFTLEAETGIPVTHSNIVPQRKHDEEMAKRGRAPRRY